MRRVETSQTVVVSASQRDARLTDQANDHSFYHWYANEAAAVGR